MASMHYNLYSQAAAQQGYRAYTAQPTQEYAQTTQAYGQLSYGTYGQPTDASYTQAQTTATYGQTTYATSYGQPPTLQLPPRHKAGLSKVLMIRYHHCCSHYNPGLLCSSVCIWHPACLPSLWPIASSHRTYKTTGW
ncbi:RNA-binding protein EWS isoform X2 [Sigmodon hispidus]